MPRHSDDEGGSVPGPLTPDGRLPVSVFVHFPLVAEAEGTDVLRLARLVGASRGGGVDVEEGRRGSVAGLAVVEALTQEQHVPQVADVAAGQA